jgi:uncharacterized protein (DUF1330 family)
MTVSAIVHTKFVDQGLKAELLGAFPQFKGALALAGEHSEVIEGETDVDKTVLASFPGLAAFTAWVESSDYTNAFLVGRLPTSYPNLFMCNASHDTFATQR